MIILPHKQLIKFLHENGNYVILAHPYWSGTRLEHFNENFNGIDGMEIYNNVCNLAYGTAGYSGIFDTAIWADRHIACFASDVTPPKGCPKPDFCGGFIMVKSASAG